MSGIAGQPLDDGLGMGIGNWDTLGTYRIIPGADDACPSTRLLSIGCPVAVAVAPTLRQVSARLVTALEKREGQEG